MSQRPDNDSAVVRLNGYLSIREAAKQIGKSRHTVYRLIRNGDLAAVRVGKHLCVRQSEITKRLKRAS